MTESLVVRGDLDLSSMVFEHILAVAQPLFEQADRQRGYIHTAEDVCARRDFVRDALPRLLGGFPERTELHPRVVGRLDRDGYVVEKLLFESRPGFHVTANLYLPTAVHGPAPAVLVPCGHAADGKAHAPYQTLAQGLARQGFIALVYDSIGQGERSQYWSPVTHRSRIGPCIPEHDHAGTQALLVGTNLAAHLVWDGIRALDALCLRDEVDTSRIGCTGDGALAACLFALDERIAAAMPVGYVTTRQAWLETGRFADAEHVQDKVIAQGIDHADLLVAGAPRPVRVAAAKTDVPIEGTRQTVDELKRMYGILDVADRVDIFEAEGGGDFGQPLREAAYQWFQQWLGDPAADTTEPAIELERPEDLWCAPEGQVAALGSRTVFSLTRDQAATLPPPAPQMSTRGDAEQWQGILRTQLRDLLHCPPSSGSPLCDQYGAFYRGKVGIELLTYQSERGVSIPALLFVPEQGGSWPGMVYVHEHGKEAEADPLGTIQMLAGEGNVVLAIDVRGIGETASADHISGDHPHMGVDGYHFYQYGMLGHSLV
ncbi:acetylxylan esterase, partial [bacterium]|nr:acetylxylan esterase [bacterium]